MLKIHFQLHFENSPFPFSIWSKVVVLTKISWNLFSLKMWLCFYKNISKWDLFLPSKPYTHFPPMHWRTEHDVNSMKVAHKHSIGWKILKNIFCIYRSIFTWCTVSRPQGGGSTATIASNCTEQSLVALRCLGCPFLWKHTRNH